MTSRTENI